MTKSKVSVVYTAKTQYYQCVKKAVNLIGLPKFPAKATIAIKPNICSIASPDSGVTTDVRVVEAIVRLLRETAPESEIVIVESDSAETNMDRAFRELGYEELADRWDIDLVNLSHDTQHYMEVNGKILSTLRVPETLLFSDFFISVPKLKMHGNERITCALKNQYGCITRKHKMKYHPFMSEILTDLNSVYKPDLIVVDGIIGMEGFGPTDGRPVRFGVILCSDDVVAVDAIASRILGFDKNHVPHLKFACKKGLGEMEDISIVGQSVPSFSTGFIPKKYYYLSRLALRIQKFGVFLQNFADFLLKGRSAAVTIGLSEAKQRLSYWKILGIAKDYIFKVDA